jgi:hypothetical protein
MGESIAYMQGRIEVLGGRSEKVRTTPAKIPDLTCPADAHACTSATALPCRALRPAGVSPHPDRSPSRTVPPVARTLRLAVAQSTVPEDPTDPHCLRESGTQIRNLMRAASHAGARLVQFPEGAVVYPSKYVMSSAGPDTVAEADWTRLPWDVLEEETRAIASLAGGLGLWTAFGAPHHLAPPHRPHNSFHVVSDAGRFVIRYDKRLLSHTEASYMYTPGTGPKVFEIDGIRFGIALCIEAHFPGLFAEYERLDTDCVLLSTTRCGPSSPRPTPPCTATGSAIPSPPSTAPQCPQASRRREDGGSRAAATTTAPVWPSPTSNSTQPTTTSTWRAASPGPGDDGHKTPSTTAKTPLAVPAAVSGTPPETLPPAIPPLLLALLNHLAVTLDSCSHPA